MDLKRCRRGCVCSIGWKSDASRFENQAGRPPWVLACGQRRGSLLSLQRGEFGLVVEVPRDVWIWNAYVLTYGGTNQTPRAFIPIQLP